MLPQSTITILSAICFAETIASSIFSAWPTIDGEYFLYAIEEAERRKEFDIDDDQGSGGVL